MVCRRNASRRNAAANRESGRRSLGCSARAGAGMPAVRGITGIRSSRLRFFRGWFQNASARREPARPVPAAGGTPMAYARLLNRNGLFVTGSPANFPAVSQGKFAVCRFPLNIPGSGVPPEPFGAVLPVCAKIPWRCPCFRRPALRALWPPVRGAGLCPRRTWAGNHRIRPFSGPCTRPAVSCNEFAIPPA